jgi:hypothetical protein
VTEAHSAPPGFLGRGFFCFKSPLTAVTDLDVDAVAWALASRAIGFYALVPPNVVLGEDYAKEFTPVIDVQLSLAGIRLAQILNDAFK